MTMVFVLPVSSFEQLLDIVFGSSASDVLFLKIGLWLVLFAVLFKALEKTLSLSKGQAAVLSVVISALSMRFMPVDWMSGLGTFIWVIVFIAVPYFFISALTQPGLWRWVIVIASYFGILYSLASYGSLAEQLGIAEFIKPVFDILAPILYLVSDMLRLHPQQFMYVLGAVIVLMIIVAVMKGRHKPEEMEAQQIQERKKPSRLWRWLFGAGKAAGKGALSAGRLAAKGAAKGARYISEDALRTKRLYSNQCMYCGTPLARGAVSCPKCGKGYAWRQRRWARKAQKEEDRKIDRMWRT